MRRTEMHEQAPGCAELLSVAEAAEMLRCSVRTVRKLTYTGGLPHLKVGRRVFYPRQALAEWVRANTAERLRPPIVPIPYIIGGTLVRRPAGVYRTPPEPAPPPPAAHDSAGRVTIEGLE